jgi:hypothetical protein
MGETRKELDRGCVYRGVDQGCNRNLEADLASQCAKAGYTLGYTR